MKTTKKTTDLAALEQKAKAAAEKATKAQKQYEQAKMKSMAYQYERMEDVCKQLNITFDEALEYLIETYKATDPASEKETDA